MSFKSVLWSIHFVPFYLKLWSLLHLMALELCVGVPPTAPFASVQRCWADSYPLWSKYGHDWRIIERELQSDSSSVLHVHSGFLPILSTWLELLESGGCVQKLQSVLIFEFLPIFQKDLLPFITIPLLDRWTWKRCSDPSFKRADWSSPNWAP